MDALLRRRSRERHLPVLEPISLRVSKPMAASLAMLALQHGSSTSEMSRLLISAGAEALGLGDLDSVG
jgi:hypothetical protein